MTYKTIAEGSAGERRGAGSSFHEVTVTIKRSDDAERCRVDIVEQSGSDQGSHDEIHHEAQVCGHSALWSDALRHAEGRAARAGIESKYLVQAISTVERELENALA